jgi:toluene monooxygenase system protein E
MGRPDRKLRTWSLWQERRVPSEYELVTHKLNYHFRRQPAPFEMSPDWPIQQWYLQYREGSEFNVDDWERYRDPYAFTYRRYVEARHERELYLDSLIDDFEAHDHYRHLDSTWLDFLRDYYLPSRFAGHCLQMTGMYVAQMSPSAYVANPFHFQAADEMRRIQRTAYLAKAIAVDTGRDDLADSQLARARWEDNPLWQPLRELMERHLVVYDWGAAFAVRNLVVKPLYDALFNDQLSNLARAADDELLALIHDDFQLYDAPYARENTIALVAYVRERRPELIDWLRQQVTPWLDLAHAAAQAIGQAFSTTGLVSPIDVADYAQEVLDRLHTEVGIR